jgi:hypothetical protein
VTTSVPVGPLMTPDARDFVDDVLTDLVTDGDVCPGLELIDGGMETAVAPYLVVRTGTGAWLFVLERRNDDGEWAPLVYACTVEVDPADEASREAVRTAAREIPASSQEMAGHELVTAGLLGDVDAFYDGTLGSGLWNALYGFRDLVSPHALD